MPQVSLIGTYGPTLPAVKKVPFYSIIIACPGPVEVADVRPFLELSGIGNSAVIPQVTLSEEDLVNESN